MDKTPDADGSTPDAQSTTETTMTTGHTMSQTPQRILITGGASGLGRAMAEAWLRDGARVLIGDVNQERAAETLAALKDLPGELQFQYLDVRDAASFNNAPRVAGAELGRPGCAGEQCRGGRCRPD